MFLICHVSNAALLGEVVAGSWLVTTTSVHDSYVLAVSDEDTYTLPADPHWALRWLNLSTGDFAALAGDIYSLSPARDSNNGWQLVYDGEMGLVNLDLDQQTTWALTMNPPNFGTIESSLPYIKSEIAAQSGWQ